VADFINSIATAKELVFEKQTVSMEKLLHALTTDFVSFEDVHKKCLDAEKYGNDLEEPDRVAAEMLSYLAIKTNTQDSKYGKLMACILPVTAHVPLGKVVGAHWAFIMPNSMWWTKRPSSKPNKIRTTTVTCWYGSPGTPPILLSFARTFKMKSSTGLFRNRFPAHP